jgi:hypothetical protein
MRGIILTATLILSGISAFSQEEKQIFWLKHDNMYLFVDDSRDCWYTFELKTDTFFQLENFMFFARNKDIQVRSSFVNGGPSFKGAQNDIATEKYILENKMDWEYKFQKKEIKGKMKTGKELYYNAANKPFLIWWIELPRNSKTPTRTIEGKVSNSYSFGLNDTSELELNVTHSLYLEFVIQGGNSTTISYSVLENEHLEDEINIAKGIANSLNVYAGPIDMILLARKIKDPADYVFRDSLGLIEINFPQKINVLDRYWNNSMMVSFPEKVNIYNAASILWEYKTGKKTFEDFIAERKRINTNRGPVTPIANKPDFKNDFYIVKNSIFHCQDVYMQSEHVFMFLNFTATDRTYNYNVELFKDLVKSIILK